MNRITRKTLVPTLGVLAAALFIAACQQQQNQTPTIGNDKRTKLVAAENAALKKTIQDQKLLHESEMRRETMLHEKQMQQQKKQLDKCLKEQKLLEEMSKDGIESYMKNVLGPLVDENEKLRAENEALKAKIQNLQAQIDGLRADSRTIKEPAGAGS